MDRDADTAPDAEGVFSRRVTAEATGSDPEAESPWTTLDGRVVYDNPWIRVREDQVLRPDGKPGIYGVVEFKNRAVGVLPVDDDGGVWLVGQYRYTLSAYSWEIPEGGCPVDESPEQTARRELLEETGLSAARLEPLGGPVHLSNSVSNEIGWLFRATGLVRGTSQPEGTERIQVRRFSWQEIQSRLARGEITDSLSVIALLYETVRRSGR
jgi:8-oxo-dGTP pyrophosphatase MutT (NUDIX family)